MEVAAKVKKEEQWGSVCLQWRVRSALQHLVSVTERRGVVLYASALSRERLALRTDDCVAGP